jgi:hypothetical protein
MKADRVGERAMMQWMAAALIQAPDFSNWT